MVQGPVKGRKPSGKSTTERRNKPRQTLNEHRNPAVRKLRKASKLVRIEKIEGLMSSTAMSNNEHLVYVNKKQKKKPKTKDELHHTSTSDLSE